MGLLSSLARLGGSAIKKFGPRAVTTAIAVSKKFIGAAGRGLGKAVGIAKIGVQKVFKGGKVTGSGMIRNVPVRTTIGKTLSNPLVQAGIAGAGVGGPLLGGLAGAIAGGKGNRFLGAAIGAVAGRTVKALTKARGIIKPSEQSTTPVSTSGGIIKNEVTSIPGTSSGVRDVRTASLTYRRKQRKRKSRRPTRRRGRRSRRVRSRTRHISRSRGRRGSRKYMAWVRSHRRKGRSRETWGPKHRKGRRRRKGPSGHGRHQRVSFMSHGKRVSFTAHRR